MSQTNVVQRTKSIGKFILKLGLTSGALYLVFSRINQEALLQQFQKLEWSFLILSFVVMVASKVISAFRLFRFLREVPLSINQRFNLKLYWLGMFYNLFLPGGIGGDGYKGYILNKHSEVSLKRIVWALLLDRISGLMALVALGMAFSAFLDIPQVFRWLLSLGPIAMYLVHFFFIQYFHKQHLGSIWQTHLLSLGVQLGQVLSAYLILVAMSQEAHVFAYLELFLLSSVVSVLPISIGGVGPEK